MKTNESMSEEIFDVMLRRALIDVYRNEANAFRKQGSAEEMSKTFEKNIKRMTSKIGLPEKINCFVKISKAILTSFAFIISVSFGMLMTRPTVYAAVENVVISFFSDHDSYFYTGKENKDEFDRTIAPNYLPENYYFVSATFYKNDGSLFYESDDGNALTLDYGKSENSQISVDNERHEMTEVSLSGITVYFYKAVNANELDTLVWYNDGYYFTLYGKLPFEEYEKIVENVK